MYMTVGGDEMSVRVADIAVGSETARDSGEQATDTSEPFYRATWYVNSKKTNREKNVQRE